jgi:hypothetical protein
VSTHTRQRPSHATAVAWPALGNRPIRRSRPRKDSDRATDTRSSGSQPSHIGLTRKSTTLQPRPRRPGNRTDSGQHRQQPGDAHCR